MFKRNQGQIEFADQWFATGMINQTLESLDRLINWEPIRNRFAKVYASYKNGWHPGFDTVMLLKLLLLEAWYDLSDGRVLEEASDRLSFRRFLGMGVADLLPDDTTLVRFRARLLEQDDLLSEVLDYVNACIQRHGFSLNTGNPPEADEVFSVEVCLRRKNEVFQRVKRPHQGMIVGYLTAIRRFSRYLSCRQKKIEMSKSEKIGSQ